MAIIANAQKENHMAHSDIQPPNTFACIVLVESTYHTKDKPFCFADDHCPCHENQEAKQAVWQWVQEGLMTPQEATNFILGRTF